jgi:hypothetical protein
VNGIELKTVRQSLFLSVAEAANINGVRERVYRYWEAGEWVVPADVDERMRQLDDIAWRWAVAVSDAHYEQVQSDAVAFAPHNQNEPWRAEYRSILVRFKSDEDLWHFRPLMNLHPGDFARMSADIHAAAVDRARLAIEADGGGVRIVLMDRDAYAAWLQENDLRHNDANLRAWAERNTDPPTRAKRIAAENEGHPSSEENQA